MGRDRASRAGLDWSRRVRTHSRRIGLTRSRSVSLRLHSSWRRRVARTRSSRSIDRVLCLATRSNKRVVRTTTREGISSPRGSSCRRRSVPLPRRPNTLRCRLDNIRNHTRCPSCSRHWSGVRSCCRWSRITRSLSRSWRRVHGSLSSYRRCPRSRLSGSSLGITGTLSLSIEISIRIRILRLSSRCRCRCRCRWVLHWLSGRILSWLLCLITRMLPLGIDALALRILPNLGLWILLWIIGRSCRCDRIAWSRCNRWRLSWGGSCGRSRSRRRNMCHFDGSVIPKRCVAPWV